MNLLYDKWIPVKRINGECDEISPLSLLEDTMDNPVKSVNTVRPDFDGAVLQFLIGLYQVLLSPKDGDEWSELLESPPNMDSLSEKIDLIAPAFVLDEGEFRFMQDKSVKGKKERSIQKILMDYLSKSPFKKEDIISSLCPSCTAMAILTLQLNAPGGGSGYRTSLRGGGPLTTLLTLSDDKITLWKLVMLNILPQDRFPTDNEDSIPDITETNIQKLFPWFSYEHEYIMPNSEKDEITTRNDMHPYHVYWGIPWRIYLNYFSPSSGNCDICGKYSDKLINKCWVQNKGFKYPSDLWVYPLTPYYKKRTNNVYLPLLVKEDSITYSNWAGIVFGSNDNSKVPAKVVKIIPNMLFDSEYKKSDLKIHAFGYDMENAKSKFWLDGELPTLLVSDDIRDNFFEEIQKIIKTSQQILNKLTKCVKSGITSNKNEKIKKGDKKTYFSNLKIRFWHDTENAFNDAVKKLENAVYLDLNRNDDNHPETDKVKTEWLCEVNRICINLFKEKVTFPIYGGADPSLAAASENELIGYLKVNNSKLRNTLGLPVKVKSSKSKVKK